MSKPLKFQPSVEEVRKCEGGEYQRHPVYAEILADMETAVSAYLKIKRGKHSFLFESVEGGEKMARYSFIGTEPTRVCKIGDNEELKGDPMKPLEEEMNACRVKSMEPELPGFTGGHVGYVSYDAVRFFEPKTAREQKNALGLPDGLFMYFDTLVVFDRLRHSIKIVAHCVLDSSKGISAEYEIACNKIRELASRLNSEVPLPLQKPIPVSKCRQTGKSNVGEAGYKKFVRTLKQRIVDGDLIQCVPSHRVARPINVHPFNVYRELRMINPSPYMYYMEIDDYVIVGASPELLVRVENNVVTTHPIAGTRKRGKTPAEDKALEDELLSDEKERSEHIMLVDLGRNDVGRVAKPGTVKIDSLMHIERYSHVMHIVSSVSGQLHPLKTPLEAFKSVFPAGTVSGAPKVRAMEYINELEHERRGVYSGAVGYFSQNSIDTCIAIRTFVYRDGIAYLQAGGGIVYDSLEHDEYMETVHKMASLQRAIDLAEDRYAESEITDPPSKRARTN